MTSAEKDGFAFIAVDDYNAPDNSKLIYRIVVLSESGEIELKTYIQVGSPYVRHLSEVSHYDPIFAEFMPTLSDVQSQVKALLGSRRPVVWNLDWASESLPFLLDRDASDGLVWEPQDLSVRLRPLLAEWDVRTSEFGEVNFFDALVALREFFGLVPQDFDSMDLSAEKVARIMREMFNWASDGKLFFEFPHSHLFMRETTYQLPFPIHEL